MHFGVNYIFKMAILRGMLLWATLQRWPTFSPVEQLCFPLGTQWMWLSGMNEWMKRFPYEPDRCGRSTWKISSFYVLWWGLYFLGMEMIYMYTYYRPTCSSGIKRIISTGTEYYTTAWCNQMQLLKGLDAFANRDNRRFVRIDVLKTLKGNV